MYWVGIICYCAYHASIVQAIRRISRSVIHRPIQRLLSWVLTFSVAVMYVVMSVDATSSDSSSLSICSQSRLAVCVRESWEDDYYAMLRRRQIQVGPVFFCLFVILLISCCRILLWSHGRPHIGANGVSWPPWKNGWKIKKRKHATKRAIRTGSCRERRYADHIFIQIYSRKHDFVVKFSKFSSP